MAIIKAEIPKPGDKSIANEAVYDFSKMDKKDKPDLIEQILGHPQIQQLLIAVASYFVQKQTGKQEKEKDQTFEGQLADMEGQKGLL